MIARRLDGDPLTAADLPLPGQRWTPRLKATLVLAIRAGIISLPAAIERYTLTHEEFLSWDQAFSGAGVSALRSTRIQQDRPTRPKTSRPPRPKLRRRRLPALQAAE